MTTMFMPGDYVKSKVAAQGMRRDEIFVVTDVHVLMTPFGGFTTYILKNGSHADLPVGNGHLLLERIAP